MTSSFSTGIILIFIQAFLYIFPVDNGAKYTEDNTFKSGHFSSIFNNPVVSPQDILFVVKHNKSPNVVVYQANWADNYNLDNERPVDVFWLMNTKGKTTENLTLIEWKLAYGFKVNTVVKGKKYKISLNAIKGRDVNIIQNQNGKVEGFMYLKGKYCKLQNIFIKFEYTLYMPDVEYLEISGSEISSAKIITERILTD